MLTAEKMSSCFNQMNDELRSLGKQGEIGLVGGAVMCLVYNARKATKDVDAIFEPSALIRKIAQKIAEKNQLPIDWLNDGAKTFLSSGFKKMTVSELSNLRIWAPEPRYMIAMKCLSARWDSYDGDDVRFLIKHLGLKKPEEVFAIINKYYPKASVPAKTKFFIEELMEQLKKIT
jgi:hypothetical protein